MNDRNPQILETSITIRGFSQTIDHDPRIPRRHRSRSADSRSISITTRGFSQTIDHDPLIHRD
jgi:hypothetical protein